MSTSIYRKPTFIGFYFSFFDSRHPGIIKKMQDTLTTRSSNIQMEWPRHSPRRDVQNKVGRRLEKKSSDLGPYKLWFQFSCPKEQKILKDWKFSFDAKKLIYMKVKTEITEWRQYSVLKVSFVHEIEY